MANWKKRYMVLHHARRFVIFMKKTMLVYLLVMLCIYCIPRISYCYIATWSLNQFHSNDTLHALFKCKIQVRWHRWKKIMKIYGSLQTYRIHHYCIPIFISVKLPFGVGDTQRLQKYTISLWCGVLCIFSIHFLKKNHILHLIAMVSNKVLLI